MVPPRRAGCLRQIFRAVLFLAALLLGVLAWDVWQLRALRPPENATFEGFLADGRSRLALTLDKGGGRLYWTAPPRPTVARTSEQPVYEFDRTGRLINWTPSIRDLKGMLLDEKVQVRGESATVDDARAWLRAK